MAALPCRRRARSRAGAAEASACARPPVKAPSRSATGSSFSAFGVAGARGGAFALEAPRLEIADGALWAVSQRLDLAEDDAGFLTIGDALFTGFGFSSFDLVATGPHDDDGLETLVVRDGADIEAIARTLVLEEDWPRD